MRYRTLGATGIQVTPSCVGAISRGQPETIVGNALKGRRDADHRAQARLPGKHPETTAPGGQR
jgi:aryl-alcohol dehydrogenase-like predicted oxidoreductase